MFLNIVILFSIHSLNSRVIGYEKHHVLTNLKGHIPVPQTEDSSVTWRCCRHRSSV
ncbi:hypothetical protein M758_12G026600 [Ceratodon purpureus]|nr:hypothetical protein M758_12G026600 [Ceratodon purpureus]